MSSLLGSILCGFLLLACYIGSCDATTALRRELNTVRGQVTKLQLIDANTDKVISDLEDGMVIALDAVQSGMNGTTVALNVVALVNGTDVRSVRFGFNGNRFFKTESNAPYTLCGNSGGNYKSCGSSRLGLGQHTITATPRNRNGQAGRPVTVNITIVERDETPPTLVSFKALTSTTVDISNGQGAQVVFELVLQDDASGYGWGSLVHFGGVSYAFFYDIAGDSPTRRTFFPLANPSINVRNNDLRTVNVTLLIKPGLPDGVYNMNVNLFDNVDNLVELDEVALGAMGFQNSITIVNTGLLDEAAPDLLSFRALTPLSISGNTTVSFEVVVRDDLSGFNFGFIRIASLWFGYEEFGKPGLTGNEFESVYNNAPDLPAGVNHTLVVSLDFTEEFPRGIYYFQLVLLDGLSNSVDFFTDDLDSRGFPSQIEYA